MEIIWFGHSSFRLRSGNISLITDPFPSTIGLHISPAMAQANVVTVSNSHPNHSAVAAIGGTPAVLDRQGEYEVSGFYVRGITTRLQGEPANAWNTAFTIQAEGLTICHLGDLGVPLTNKQLEQMTPADVLLLPVGGRCTISPTQAIEVLNRIEPRIVVPMHYAHAGNSVELESLAPFLRELGAKEPETQPRANITRNSLPAELQVLGLQPIGAGR